MSQKARLIDVAVDDLTSLVKTCLRVIDVPEADIETVSAILMYAELRGNNQGLVKIVGRNVVPDTDKRPIEITRRMPCATHIKGNGNVGMVVVKQAAEEACDLANLHGIGLVGTSHTSTSTGAIGYYAESIAKQELIGIVMAGSPKAVAISGGIDPVFGTNPIAIGVPSKKGPVVLDMTTASMAYFGLIQAERRNESIPDGVAFDRDGNATTDPTEALKGAIKAFGGHKGSGLALMVEILTGPLLGTTIYGDENEGKNNGNLIIAINPCALGEPEEFQNRVDTLIERIKTGRLASGSRQISLPGERGNSETQSKLDNNRMSIDRDLFLQLNEIAQN
jgi:L-2-hydroxycarboxylate dehydrogenase (NAD+)